METDLLQDLEPNVLSPVRSNGSKHESLELDVAHQNIAVHANAGGSSGLTVGITSAGEVEETGLQGKLEVGARMKLVGCYIEIVRFRLTPGSASGPHEQEC